MALDTQLIRDSFALVKPVAMEVMTHFYGELFKNFPGVVPLFQHVDLSIQKKALASGLTYIVDNVDNSEKLVPYLKQMGARHVRYGATPEHYPAVGQTLLGTFKYFFKDQWTPKLEAEWTTAYGVIVDVMLAGAKEAADSAPQAKAAPAPRAVPANLEELSFRLARSILARALESEAGDEFMALAKEKAKKILAEALETEALNVLNAKTKNAA